VTIELRAWRIFGTIVALMIIGFCMLAGYVRSSVATSLGERLPRLRLRRPKLLVQLQTRPGGASRLVGVATNQLPRAQSARKPNPFAS
jgi:hypothetical protein